MMYPISKQTNKLGLLFVENIFNFACKLRFIFIFFSSKFLLIFIGVKKPIFLD